VENVDNTNERSFEPVAKGQFVLSNLGGDYIQIAAGEPFEAHISAVEVTKDKKYGAENDDELVDRLVIKFTIDEDMDGKGQVYTNWYTPSLNPKSKLYPLLMALYSGDIPIPLDVTDLIGRPLRLTLTEGVERNGKFRQYAASYLKPKSTQNYKVPDNILTDTDEDIIKEVFGE
jgi:hypothetical protein